MQIMWNRSQFLFRLLLLLGSIVFILAVPASVRAGTCTSISGIEVCGDVANDSPAWIEIAGCWPDSSSAPRYYTTMPGCTNVTLPAGARSDTTGTSHYVKDTDTFRVDAGCITKFKDTSLINVLFPYNVEITEDRRGKVYDKWIKLADPDAIHITYQFCPGGNPPHHYAQTWANANGYQDQYCYGDGGSGDAVRCNSDGTLFAGRNYFICRVWGDRVGTTTGYNHWWLLTDLDAVNSGRDGRSYVSAYYLTGGKNSENDSAYDENGNWIPEC